MLMVVPRSASVVSYRREKPPVLSGEHGRIKPWSANEMAWFPLPKP